MIGCRSTRAELAHANAEISRLHGLLEAERRIAAHAAARADRNEQRVDVLLAHIATLKATV